MTRQSLDGMAMSRSNSTPRLAGSSHLPNGREGRGVGWFAPLIVRSLQWVDTGPRNGHRMRIEEGSARIGRRRMRIYASPRPPSTVTIEPVL